MDLAILEGVCTLTRYEVPIFPVNHITNYPQLAQSDYPCVFMSKWSS